jgi:hypothetical protein
VYKNVCFLNKKIQNKTAKNTNKNKRGIGVKTFKNLESRQKESKAGAFTRREFFKKAQNAAIALGSAALFSKFFSSCYEQLGPEGYEPAGKEITIQKGAIGQLGPLRVRLAGVMVENEYKQIKIAIVEFLKEDESAYFTWGFNLHDIKTGIKPPGGGSQTYAVECTGLPEFSSNDEWVQLRLWKKVG